MAWPVVLLGGVTALARKASVGAVVAGIVTGVTYMFKTKLGLFIVTAMIWLGINFASLKIVVEPAIDLLLGYASQPGTGGGDFAAVAWGWMGVLNFDRAITMVVSAVGTRLATARARLFLMRRAAPGAA